MTGSQPDAEQTTKRISLHAEELKEDDASDTSDPLDRALAQLEADHQVSCLKYPLKLRLTS
jgi:hypothetical protein